MFVTNLALEAATGQVRWRSQLDGEFYASPVVVDTVYIGNSLGTLGAFDTASGTERGRDSSGYSFGASPAVVNNSVYMIGTDGTVHALGNLEPTMLVTDVTLRGAPASTGFERGAASAGETIDKVGARGSSGGLGGSHHRERYWLDYAGRY